MVSLNPNIVSQEREITLACQANGVKRLELFGSRARQDSRDSSDFDFLVEFVDLRSPGLLDRFLALKQALEVIVGGPVDLVEVSSIQNPFLRKRIDQDRTLVYAA
jgi:uncharacterized protein